MCPEGHFADSTNADADSRPDIISAIQVKTKSCHVSSILMVFCVHGNSCIVSITRTTPSQIIDACVGNYYLHVDPNVTRSSSADSLGKLSSFQRLLSFIRITKSVLHIHVQPDLIYTALLFHNGVLFVKMFHYGLTYFRYHHSDL